MIEHYHFLIIPEAMEKQGKLNVSCLFFYFQVNADKLPKEFFKYFQLFS